MEFLDDFEGWYAHAKAGEWADRFYSHWIWERNPRGYCDSLRIVGTHRLACYRYLNMQDRPGEWFRAEVDQRPLHFVRSLADAKAAADAALPINVRVCPACGADLTKTADN